MFTRKYYYVFSLVAIDNKQLRAKVDVDNNFLQIVYVCHSTCMFLMCLLQISCHFRFFKHLIERILSV